MNIPSDYIKLINSELNMKFSKISFNLFNKDNCVGKHNLLLMHKKIIFSSYLLIFTYKQKIDFTCQITLVLFRVLAFKKFYIFDNLRTMYKQKHSVTHSLQS